MAEHVVLEVSPDVSVGQIVEELAAAGPGLDVAGQELRSDSVIVVAAVVTRESATRIGRDAIAAVVEQADGAEFDRLSAAATTDPDDGLDENFWGPSPDDVAVSRAVFTDLQQQFARRRNLLVHSVSRDQAAELLGVSAQSITARLAAGTLVGIKSGREWRLPHWQFDADDPSGVLPDLDALQAAFPGGVVSLSRWIQRRQPEFGGRTPREEMSRHGSAAVMEYARTLTAAGW